MSDKTLFLYYHYLIFFFFSIPIIVHNLNNHKNLVTLNLEKPKKKIKPGKQTNLKTKPLNQKMKKQQQKN